MKIRLSALIICFIVSLHNMTAYSMVPKIIIESQVHSLEQFFDRLNGKEIFPIIDDTQNDKMKATRISLFDMDFRFKYSNRDSIISVVSEFLEDLDISGVKVNISDPENWMEVKCIFMDGDHKIPISLCLNFEEYKKDYWRWAISDIKDCDELLKDLEKPIPINPLEHEIHFMNFDQIFSTAKGASYRLKSSNKKIDPLSYFFGLLSSGKLQFKESGDIVFHSKKVPGWEFTVSEIYRLKSSNSGWMITSLKKTTNTSN